MHYFCVIHYRTQSNKSKIKINCEGKLQLCKVARHVGLEYASVASQFSLEKSQNLHCFLCPFKITWLGLVSTLQAMKFNRMMFDVFEIGIRKIKKHRTLRHSCSSGKTHKSQAFILHINIHTFLMQYESKNHSL